jgi:hypothetical protein
MSRLNRLQMSPAPPQEPDRIELTGSKPLRELSVQSTSLPVDR